MHRLVLRQLRRHFGNQESLPEEWKAFVQEVSDAYTSTDEDRRLAERSLELTSQELIQRLEERMQAEKAQATQMARLQALNSLTQQISGITDLDEILESIAHSAAELLDIPFTRVFIVQDETLELRAEHGGLTDPGEKGNSPVGHRPDGLTVSFDELFYIEDVRTSSAWNNPAHLRNQDIGSYVGVPLKSGKRVLGLLECVLKEVRSFTKNELELLETLANAGTIAIENARLHSEARQSLNFFRSIIEDTAIAILVQDPERRIIKWNKGAEKLFGFTEREVLGQSVKKLIPEGMTSTMDLTGEKVFRQGTPYTFETDRLRKDGTLVPVSITISPVKNENGKVIAASTMYKDLSEYKRAEALEKSKEAAETASQAKSEFLSTMSHELRSPLNTVIGFSDLIMRNTESKDEMTLQLVPKIRESGKYLLVMIEEILDLDRIEAGKTRLKLEPIVINDLTTEVVDSWRARIPAGFSLTSELDPACGIIQCDTTRISQILNNLIDNAVKYSPEGGAICIRTHAEADEVHVSVRDEGMGIAPVAQKTIFERFHQLESGYTRRAGGLGIGLAIVRNLIEMHGGHIRVDSGEGAGSTFTFALPRIRAIHQKALGHDDDTEEMVKNKDPWHGRSILIVDDLEHYHEYMKLLMRDATRLESAYSGEEAIEVAKRVQPDLILMDLRMPVLDGFEAIRHLKSEPATKGIPILAVTAQAMEEDRTRSAQAGADGLITKPIDIEAFKTEMGRVLGTRV